MRAEPVTPRPVFPKQTLYLEILMKGITGRGKEQNKWRSHTFVLFNSFFFFAKILLNISYVFSHSVMSDYL